MNEVLKAIPRATGNCPTQAHQTEFVLHWNDGVRTVTVDKWPDVICLHAELLENADPLFGLSRKDDLLTFSVSNGEAIYRLFSYDPILDRYWAERQ